MNNLLYKKMELKKLFMSDKFLEFSSNRIQVGIHRWYMSKTAWDMDIGGILLLPKRQRMARSKDAEINFYTRNIIKLKEQNWVTVPKRISQDSSHSHKNEVCTHVGVRYVYFAHSTIGVCARVCMCVSVCACTPHYMDTCLRARLHPPATRNTLNPFCMIFLIRIDWCWYVYSV